MSAFLQNLRKRPFVLRNQQSLQFLDKMMREYPAARFHRQVLQELGCDFSYAGKDIETGCWDAIVDLNTDLQKMLGITSGIQVMYTPFADLQPRTITHMRKRAIDRKRSESIYFLHTPDIYASTKLNDWTFRETYSVLSLPSNGNPHDVALDLLERIVEASSRNNPYERTTPVSGVEFFGRQETLKGLSAEIRKGHVCGLFGLRKTGKTSLLSELGRLFQLGDSKNSIYILQDLEVLPSNVEEKVPQLITNIANQLQIDFKRHGMRTHEISMLTHESTAGDLRQAIEASLRLGVGKEKMVVIALDEVESLVGSASSMASERTGIPELFGALRALVQENKNFNVVLSGITTAPIMYPTLFGRENPLFAWAKPTFVAHITRSETQRMIRDLGFRMAAHWTDAAIDKVYEFTGGQVFLTRSFAGHVAGTLSTDISNRVISETRVKENFRGWNRSAVLLVDGMLDSLQRFYPTELEILQLGIEEGSFDEIELDYVGEISNLVNLGVLHDTESGLELAPWTQLGSKFRNRSS